MDTGTLTDLDIQTTSCVEDITYFENDNDNDVNSQSTTPLTVKVKSVTTTVGCNVVSDEYDVTGIMIWPATHLMCQQILSRRLFKGQYVVELGCGVGLVGITACKSKNPPSLWASTDADGNALYLCHINHQLNDIQVRDSQVQSGALAWIRNIRWGDDVQISALLNELQRCRGSNKKFDSVVGADIVYPSTCGRNLQNLFHTVDKLLRPGGTFYLAFASRDGHKSPSRLIEAASATGYVIECETSLDDELRKLLPPLLDSKLLLLTRSVTAEQINNALGSKSCPIFPGLKEALARMNDESDDEAWEPPFDSDNEHD
jgi:predicted nicotinamide N-methyase